MYEYYNTYFQSYVQYIYIGPIYIFKFRYGVQKMIYSYMRAMWEGAK